jgi:predicted lipoprotein with Yx(FWY)xxD motif
MKRLLILGGAVAIVVAVVVVIVAYSGSGGDNSSRSAASATSAATVSTEEIGDEGAVLVDSSGRALYASDQENAAGMVLCTDACTSFWEPLTLSSGTPTGDTVSGELGVAGRPDGTRQVTLDGKLLYTFTEDEPGEVTGDGFEDAFAGQTLTWHVVHADGSTGSSGGGTTSTGPFGY